MDYDFSFVLTYCQEIKDTKESAYIARDEFSALFRFYNGTFEENISVIDGMIDEIKNEIENELKFPIELKGKEYEYSDSWSAHFRIGVNRKGDLSKICLLVADNSLVINNSKGIAKLKFVPIETLDDEQIEVNLEVKFSVASFSNNEPNLRIVK